MKISRDSHLLLALAPSLAAGAALSWLFADFGPFGNWLLPTMLLALSGTAALALVGVYFWQTRADEANLRRYVELLCRGDNQDASHELLEQSFANLETQYPALEMLSRVRQTLAEQQRRRLEAEHARASLEVRVKRVQAERAQLADILDGLGEPLLVIDQFDELVLANRSASKALALPPANEARVLAELVRCEALVDLLTETRRRKTPTQRCAEIALADEQGQQRWYRVACSNLAAQGQAAGEEGAEHEDPAARRGASARQGAVAVLSDISGQKAAQKRNAEFVSSVSHEMKTPLASIRAYVELLADGDAEDEDTREGFLAIIQNQTDRLQRLIDNLLNLARIEAGVVEVRKRDLSLNELLQDAFNLVQPQAEQKRLQLERDFSALYLGAYADRDLLLQAVINLLSNAIKYTPPGGSVVLRSKVEDARVAFEVQDTGVGLAPDDCRRVFEKFYRVKKDTHMASGTGLGLPLAKHIVEEIHGGELTVTSEPGQGSTFRVSLPRKLAT